jgi:SAM-dependent methyltransferase
MMPVHVDNGSSRTTRGAGKPDAKDSDAWRAYYKKTVRRPPCETLMFALARFDEEGVRSRPRLAIDLGCGNGHDTIELLRRGWRVLAIDAQRSAVESLLARPDLPPAARIETRIGRFETARWPAADLVNSSFALPLCPPDRFPGVWRKILRSLRRGGRFSGQLFGDRDDWAGDPTITCHTRAEMERLLDGVEVEYFVEEEDDSVTPRGRRKNWHLFHLVIRAP